MKTIQIVQLATNEFYAFEESFSARFFTPDEV